MLNLFGNRYARRCYIKKGAVNGTWQAHNSKLLLIKTLELQLCTSLPVASIAQFLQKCTSEEIFSSTEQQKGYKRPAQINKYL